METIVHLRNVLWNDAQYLFGSAASWFFVATGHVVKLSVDIPVVVKAMPYIQVTSLGLASIASLLTIYKIRKDLKK